MRNLIDPLDREQRQQQDEWIRPESGADSPREGMQMQWMVDLRRRIKQQYSSWQVPKSVREKMRLQDGDECIISIEAGSTRFHRKFKLTSGGEFWLKKADEAKVRLAAGQVSRVKFEVVLDPEFLTNRDDVPRIGKLVAHSVLTRVLRKMEGTRFTTLDFIGVFQKAEPIRYAQVLAAYGEGGKGSGSHYSSRSHIAKSLSNLSRSGAEGAPLRFIEYISAPLDAGSPVVALWEYSRNGDTVRWGASLDSDLQQLLADRRLSETQRQQMILARLGQGAFRADLIKYWGCCAITGCRDLRVLVASHIMPWSKSNSNERLDAFNGLLLTPNFDRLFDQGLISFSDLGKIMISEQLSSKVKGQLGIRSGLSVRLERRHLHYMAYHRKFVFV